MEAAHTFFMANPEHMEMQQNIEDYRETAGVEAIQLVDREARPHMESYNAGVKHYEADDFEAAIKYFEQALREYYNEDVACRALCEGPQRFEEYEYLGYKGGLYEAIADHYMQVLVCQHECVRELATRPGRLSPIENFLPLHYDYLQFAYYRVGEYVKALECAKAYLMFHPDDEDVLDNVDYYESLLDDSIDPESIEAREFGYEGRVPLKSARLFYDISEKARKIVESYFMLNSTLYFFYTHMVCRTALSGQQDRRNDLSHPIHADNCLLDPEANECWKEPPAYTFRDYSALLYMNDDFEGGEFIFTEIDAKTVTASIKPKCGRMISFSSGGENPHGVKAVTRGQRCAVALWFTLDPLYREVVSSKLLKRQPCSLDRPL
ncbi:Prolyl 3-hydroxylase 2 [Cricetulus griseus]|uniref:procollagen-proline 3-dioxygenase n=1 Tax=Cricetulus griseus TaxID=10029 RepID=G3GT82_CRIGR|nr:Prolyl 3-hydroxylase 2 [Cricetulus griseus]